MTEPIYNTDFYYVRTDINEFLREQSELPKDAALPTQRVLPKHPAGRRRDGCATARCTHAQRQSKGKTYVGRRYGVRRCMHVDSVF